MFRGTIKMKVMVFLWLFSSCTMNIQATTHWMVTESGLIQPREDSPFEMTHPYDLLAFLNQDTRWDNIFNLYDDLSKRQEFINKLWTDIKLQSDVSDISTYNENCIQAGQLTFLDWYASFLEDGKSKKIADEEYMLYKPSNGHDTEVPDCKKISSLTFSMHAFEHLQGMIQRENLTANPELALPELISPIMTVDQFGHWAAVCLKKNSSSWLHYNMASLYWRVRGNAPKAMECSRRAVHYAPRKYKDVALLSLGSILHRSKKTSDAIVVLGAAVDHDPEYHTSHFILATAYAVLGEYNNSLKHLDESLKINPDFDLGINYRYGMLCHIALGQRMALVKDLVDTLREELIAFQSREAYWLKSQAAFLRTMKDVKDFDYTKLDENCDKMSALTGLDIKDIKKEGDKNSVIQYFLDGPVSLGEKLERKGVYALDSALSLNRLVKHVEKHAHLAQNYVPPDISKDWQIDGPIAKEIGPMPVFSDMLPDIQIPMYEPPDEKPIYATSAPDLETKSASSTNEHMVNYYDGHVLYPTTMKVNRNVEDFDREKDWPSNRFCKENAPSFPPHVEAIYPVFLPFENKGIRLKALLTDQIGVPANQEHELPWHPPICPQDKEASFFTQRRTVKQQITNMVVNTDYLRQKLQQYVSEGDVESVKKMQDVEIGHRIYTAMQMNLAPRWLLYTLTSLYWRVRGNNANALHCLMTASRIVDSKYKDIVLTSMASVYLEMGYFDESLLTAEESFRASLYEPATNFVLAELNMIKKHRNTHMFHLKQVIRVEPKFLGGLARNLLNAWACILMQINTLQEVDYTGGDVCTQVEPGVNMVCEKDGTNCHMTNIQCFSSQERESSTLTRMMEQKEKEKVEDKRVDPTNVDQMDDSMFDAFIENMPLERSDLSAHRQNYDSMIRSVETALKGCGPRKCSDIQPEDLSLKDEDCTYQYLQLGYWLHIVSFRTILEETNVKVPAEILALPPSDKDGPECVIPPEFSEDFYLERLGKVNTAKWEPMMSLMHQFTEEFDHAEFWGLGYKIAKYVESKPRWWVGLLAAGWWCGAGGRGACCVRCFAAAHLHAPPHQAAHALRGLANILHL
ncbi:tetratricopeptide repeat protein 17 [Ostrinia nubilalis]|uniref:tetratricopeptide repeat protein 17 n=1 Tax=Ostrinia nubilalis TaxID=29057 RepID=UPI0030825C32